MDQQEEFMRAVAEAKSRITEVSPREAMPERARGDVVFLDVREPQEWNLVRIPGAVHVPLAQVESGVDGAVPRDRPVIVYCARGNRSALAADRMQAMGFSQVRSLAGGIQEWVQTGGEVET